MHTNSYDIVIVGGGPAGSTLARLLGERYRILLIDRDRSKCCGGLLAPDAQKMIAQLGLVMPDSLLQGPQLFSVKVHDFDNNLTRHYQRHYINIDRNRFDKWLLSLLQPHVTLCVPGDYEGCQTEAGKDRLTVDYRQDGVLHSVETRLLVGADGAFSKVRRRFFPERQACERYLAVQHWYEPGIPSPSYGAFFDAEVTDYYSWTIPKGDRLIVGAAIPIDWPVKERFALFLDKLTGLGFKLENLVAKESAQIVRPFTGGALSSYCHDRPVALIGEAGGWISPSSAEGISYAMQSARCLARSLEQGIDGFQKRYRHNLRSLFRNIRLKRWKMPFMYSRTLRRWILRSGLLSMEVESNGSER